MHRNFVCPKCHERTRKTSHHVYPRRIFGRDKKLRAVRLLLCRTCHDELERLIPFEEQPLEFYTNVIFTFLNYEPRHLRDMRKYLAL